MRFKYLGICFIYVLFIFNALSLVLGIDSCQTINVVGTYNLTQNISNIGGTCLNIEAAITLDCQGHSITGVGTGNGIYLSGTSDGSTIKNCVVDNFNIGIQLSSSNSNVISDIVVQNNIADGFDLYSSDSNVLTNVTAINNGDSGIEIRYNSNSNIVQDSLTYDNTGYGLRLDGDDSTGHQILRNNFTDDYLYYAGTLSQTFTDNVYDMNFTGLDKAVTLVSQEPHYLTSNLSGGARFIFGSVHDVSLDCQGHSITGDSSSYGLYFISTFGGADVSNCTLDSFERGVYFHSSNSNTLANVVSKNSITDGFDLYSSDSNVLTNITAINNGDSGIEIRYNSNSNIIQDSLTYDNTGYGLRLDGDDSTGHQILRNNFTDDYVYYVGSPSQTFTDNVYDMDFTDLNKPISLVSQEPHYLTSDLSGGARFIFSRVHDVSLDCQDHSITGDGSSYGLYFAYVSGGVDVSNCVLDNFDRGVYFDNGASNTLTNVTSKNSVTDGFDLYANSDSNVLTNVTAINSGDCGIEIRYNSNSNIIQDSLTYDNTGYGLRLDGDDSSGHQILRNNFTDDYVYYVGSPSQTFTDNVYDMDFTDLNKPISLVSQEPHYLTSDLSGGARFIFSRVHDVSLDCQDHSITGDGSSYGLYFIYVSGGVDVSNCVLDNFDRGVYFDNGASNTLTNVTSKNSVTDGFDLYANSDSNVLTNVTAINSGDCGIEIRTNSNSNIIQDSLTYDNTGYGLRLDGDDSSGHQILRNNFTDDYVYYRSSHSQTFTDNVYDMDFSDLNKPITIVSSETHYLTSDVSGGGKFIVCKSPSFTFDCQGNKIIGDTTGYAFDFFFTSNQATIDKCVIENFNYGIYMYYSDNHIITHSNFTNNVYSVYLTTSADNNIFYNNFYDDGDDIYKAASVTNYFKATVNGSEIGNFWGDFTCLETEEREGYFVCTNPASYTVGSTGYTDTAPLASWGPIEPITETPDDDCVCAECPVCSECTVSAGIASIFPFQDDLMSIVSLGMILLFLFS